MINVVETKKLTKLVYEEKEIVVNSEDTIVWTQIKAEVNEKDVTVNEGDNVQFVTDSGELKKGIVSKLTGKKDKVRITIGFEDGHEETWGIGSIKEDSLKILKNEDNDEE